MITPSRRPHLITVGQSGRLPSPIKGEGTTDTPRLALAPYGAGLAAGSIIGLSIIDNGDGVFYEKDDMITIASDGMVKEVRPSEQVVMDALHDLGIFTLEGEELQELSLFADVVANVRNALRLPFGFPFGFPSGNFSGRSEPESPLRSEPEDIEESIERSLSRISLALSQYAIF